MVKARVLEDDNRSPSSRRAWIEILGKWERSVYGPVALLAEGVDRNNRYVMQGIVQGKVALLAEGVDRNKTVVLAVLLVLRRPPRGGRG